MKKGAATRSKRDRARRRLAVSKWRAAPAALVDTFTEAVRPLAGAAVRKMFGYPAAFANGHMFAGVFQSSVFVRLDAGQRAALLRRPGAAPFEPMPGRAMKEYVVVPAAMIETPRELGRWLSRALTYVNGLPPKARR